MLKEFKKFIARGNVVDLAVAVIIGGAFNRIVHSLVNDVLMPVLGLLLGQVNLQELKFSLGKGSVTNTEITLNYGMFLQTTLDFLILAFSVFLIVKGINAYKAKAEDPKNVEAVTPKDIELLSEIRDILKSRERKD